MNGPSLLEPRPPRRRSPAGGSSAPCPRRAAVAPSRVCSSSQITVARRSNGVDAPSSRVEGPHLSELVVQDRPAASPRSGGARGGRASSGRQPGGEPLEQARPGSPRRPSGVRRNSTSSSAHALERRRRACRQVQSGASRSVRCSDSSCDVVEAWCGQARGGSRVSPASSVKSRVASPGIAQLRRPALARRAAARGPARTLANSCARRSEARRRRGCRGEQRIHGPRTGVW